MRMFYTRNLRPFRIKASGLHAWLINELPERAHDFVTTANGETDRHEIGRCVPQGGVLDSALFHTTLIERLEELAGSVCIKLFAADI